MKFWTAAIAVCAVLASVSARADATSDAILRRLDKMERENAALRAQVHELARDRAPRRVCLLSPLRANIVQTINCEFM